MEKIRLLQLPLRVPLVEVSLPFLLFYPLSYECCVCVCRAIEQPTAAPAQSANMDPMEALKTVMHSALIHNGLRKGLREATKALDRKSARLCCLAKDCDEPSYFKLVTVRCICQLVQSTVWLHVIFCLFLVDRLSANNVVFPS